ncbi:tetratricopeptide repeat-containing sulfotransferase family protein [Pseudidiomarina atlantica]|uniref:tetratricopeptide repeat-containing sulfotransferase family protein n=1 Tax=Pseudidiomarina atlantica TaxID=1517416 RepID=UPI00068D081C|nr:tetratricopeptide repeat-containing sulfotransferase family protein [Pseudidiomarina atlantica]
MQLNTPKDPLPQVANAVQTLARQGQLEEAKQMIRAAAGDDVSAVPVLHRAFQLAMQIGYPREALGYINRALNELPDQPVFILDKLNALVASRQRAAAIELLKYADKTINVGPGFTHELARIYQQLDMPKQALTLLNRIVKAHPEHVEARFDQALNQFFTNKMSAAEKNLDWVIEATQGKAARAYHVRSQLRKQTEKKNHIAELEERLKQADKFAAPIWFALAKEYEDLGQYEASFKALEKANKAQRALIKYEEQSELAAIDKLIASASTFDFSGGKVKQQHAITPIFVVGMPRTGTTLVERMLATHSDVTSLGEFQDFPWLLNSAINELELAGKGSVTRDQALEQVDFAALGERYLQQASELAQGKAFVVDKLPFNYLYVGFIKKALPHAKIVHLSREPLDACYAIYKTLFNQVYSFSYDQKELANYFNKYREVMALWEQTCGDAMLTLRYETLVTDTEAQARTLLQHCGLKWQDEVLNFHAQDNASTTASASQVRQPVNAASVGKAQHYAEQLRTMQRILSTK